MSWRRAAVTLGGILALALFHAPLHASLPPGFVEQTIGGTWNEAVGLTFAADGKMFVWERGGRVWLVEDGVRHETPVIDISEEVGAWQDYGMLGVALHPNFLNNGYIYLFYVVDHHYLAHYGTPSYDPAANEYFQATIGRLTRYRVRVEDDFHTVDPASRTVLLGETGSTGCLIQSVTHGVGALAFAPDGTLLASCGEGANPNIADAGGTAGGSYSPQALAQGYMTSREDVGAFRAQMVDSLSGKVLRIDPDTGDGIPSNPFYDPANPRAPRSRVWALGLRNPFRILIKPGTGSHDPADGDPGVVYIGDVGWSTWEELNVATGPGMNFGWPLFEGMDPQQYYPGISPANPDAPNPLFGVGGCNQQYFNFRDLLIQDTLNPNPSFPNPCNPSQQIPASIPHFVQRRPVLDWGHSPWGPSRYGYFVGNDPAYVETDEPPLNGPQFGGNASVGGVWYTGTEFPPAYQNVYFHADYGGQWIREVAFDANDRPIRVGDFYPDAGAVVALATSPLDGSLYYVKWTTEVRKVSYVGTGNQPPRAVASVAPGYGPSPLTVQFTGNTSTDPEGLPLTYTWNFFDGSPVSHAANPSHAFTAPAGVPTRFDPVLTVTDSGGLVSDATVTVSVNNTPPSVTITSPANGTLYGLSGNTTYNLTANISDAEHGPAQRTCAWQTILHHNNHEHQDPVDNNCSTTATIAPLGCDGNVYYYRFVLTVTDAAGLSTTAEVRAYPDCGAPSAVADNASVVRGQSVSIDVLANDTSAVPLDRASVEVVSPPAHGATGPINPTTGAITYTNDGSASTTDVFAYRVADSSGFWSNNATVNLLVVQAGDTTPPSVPANLNAVAAGPTAVNLSWSPSTDAGTGVAGYRIFRNNVSMATTTATSYADTGLTPQTTYSYQVAAYDAAVPPNESARSTPAVNVTTPGTSAFVLRVNAGGGDFLDSQGRTWVADTGFNTGNAGSTGSAISGTVDDALYQTERWDPSSAPELAYSFVVPNGGYTVNLHFAEISSFAATVPRRFDVTIEGQLVLDDFDINAQVGTFAALVRTFNTNVTDGVLNIGFAHVSENPKISAIEILGQTGPADTTPPTVPGGVNAVATSATAVNVTWSASSDSGAGVAGYRIFRNNVSIATTTATSYADSGLTPQTTYSYQVSAYDAAVPSNESARSSPAVNVTTPALVDTTPPTVPTGVNAVATGTTTVNLSWTASTDAGAGVAGYRIFRNNVAVATSATTSFADSGLTAQTTYSYQVSAFDAASPANESARSTPAVNVTTPAPSSFVLRVRAGGGTFVDSLGRTWSADTGFNTGNTGSTSTAIAGTVDDALYQTERWDPSSAPELTYTFAVPNGGYTVNLHFAEISSFAATVPRRFDVTIEGQLVLDDFDINAQVGTFTALVRTFNVAVTDGQLNVAFAHVSENPKISAIEVLGQGGGTDTTPPTVPTGVNAVAASATSVNVSWSASTDAGTGVAGYRIFRNNVSVATTTATSYADTGLTAQTTYSYQVAAYDAATPANESARSTPAVNVTTPAAPDTTPPTVPAGLNAVATGPTAVNLSWTASTDAGTGVAGYRIFRNNVSVATTTATSYADTGLTAQTTYSYQVAAYDAAVPANESARSTPAVNVTTPAAPDTTPPTVPTGVNAGAASPTSVNVSWSASTDSGTGVAGYRIFRNNVSVATTTSLGYVDTGLTPQTTYSYQVAAYDVAIPPNESARSTPAVNVTTPAAPDTTPPTVPTGLSTNATSPTSVNLTWTASSDTGTGVAGYRIFRDNVAIGTSGTTSYVDSGLQSQTTYSYQVAAYDAAVPPNESARSTPAVNATTPAPSSFVLRINAGGGPYLDLQARQWSADTGYNTGSSGATSSPIAGTADDPLYQSERWDASAAPELAYSFAVPNGAYTVNLHFAEISSWAASVGRRFDVTIEGQLVLDDFDINAQVGTFTALVRSFNVTVSDGQLNIVFTHVAENPKISAIEVLGQSGVADTTPPTVPTGVNGIATGSTTASLSWTGSTDAGTGVAGYRIFRNNVSVATTAATSYADSGLTPQTTYSYQVAAYDAAVPANESARSTPAVNVTTSAAPDTTPPTVPGGVNAVATGPNAVNVSWTASADAGTGVAGYRIFRNNVSVATTATTSYADTGLTPQTSYSYQVAAYDAATPPNESARSTPAVNVTTPAVVDTTPPTVPTGVNAAATGSTSVNLSWTASTDAGTGVAGYRIFRNNVSVATTAATSYADAGLTPQTTYSYQVAAYDGASPANESAHSTPAVNVTTPAPSAFVLRVNAGGGTFVDSQGRTWAADTGFNTGNSGSTGSAIAGTVDDALYQTERWDPSSTPELTYSFAVPNGTYTVNLHFAEISSWAASVGRRFDVTIEGQLVLDDFDINAQVGTFTAVVRGFNVTVSDGQLNIGFAHVAENPKISAIEVLGN